MDEKKEPTLLQQRKKDLFFAPTNGYDRLAPGEEEDIQAYCAGYKTFLDEGKTERECVDYAIGLAEAAGFRPLVRGEKLRPGDKVYRNNRGKSLPLAVIGQESLNRDGPERPGARGQHRGGPHRLPPPGPEAESSV